MKKRRWKTWDDRYNAARRAGCSREEAATKAELYMMRMKNEYDNHAEQG